MNKIIKIGNRVVSEASGAYIVAEMSANHLQDYDRAVAIVKAAAEAGANAIKLQTYTPDSITIDCDSEIFRVSGELWKDRTFYDLYKEAYTPWEWHAKLMKVASDCGIDCFSSPFDCSAVRLIDDLNMPAIKIASYEINDIPLIRTAARTKRPIILATGVATLEDIDLALDICAQENNFNVILLKCVSSYPAPYDSINLRVIPTLADRYDILMGLSDHSMGHHVPIASIAMGACMIEKHLTLSRADGGPDGAFSMEPSEFKAMVREIRQVESALGNNEYVLTNEQIREHDESRSLFVVKDIRRGDVFTSDNIRSIRPGIGLHTKYYDEVIGRVANTDIMKGTPMNMNMIE